jgi:hypothetical protein
MGIALNSDLQMGSGKDLRRQKNDRIFEIPVTQRDFHLKNRIEDGERNGSTDFSEVVPFGWPSDDAERL